MRKTDSPAKKQSFQARYKLQGIIAAVVSMWVSYAWIHQGLAAADPGVLNGGMAFMFVAVAIAYYFG
ncbi:MAG: hypothetical protein O3A25_14455 [Acidobacteria bacterium]|nr:hypothetical protein [Acidobacteriota bacterium]